MKMSLLCKIKNVFVLEKKSIIFSCKILEGFKMKKINLIKQRHNG